MEYVTNTRLEQAKIKLIRTQKNVEEIADEVGKGDPGFLQGLGIRLGDIDVAHDAVLWL